MTTTTITNITRGCGKRKPGGLYVCTGLSKYGLPVEHFLIDSPLPYDGGPFRAPMIMERDNVNHLLLWVGEEYYEYVTDFIEEVKRFGCSKRIPCNFDISQLQQGSKMFLIHPNAIISNHSDLPAASECPKDFPHHLNNEEYCIGQAYNNVIPNHNCCRKVGDTIYSVTYYDSEFAPLYEPGIFMALPITNFDYVKDGDNVSPEIVEIMDKTDIPLNFTEE